MRYETTGIRMTKMFVLLVLVFTAYEYASSFNPHGGRLSPVISMWFVYHGWIIYNEELISRFVNLNCECA